MRPTFGASELNLNQPFSVELMLLANSHPTPSGMRFSPQEMDEGEGGAAMREHCQSPRTALVSWLCLPVVSEGLHLEVGEVVEAGFALQIHL